MASETAGVSPHQQYLANQRRTWEGCSVLLDINDGDRFVFARLSSGATLKIGNKKCSLRPLIGCPYGSVFRVESSTSGSHLVRCFYSSTLLGNAATAQDKCYFRACGEMKDNRSLFDNNTAQGLSLKDIDSMKREGATGYEIVEALVANSSTFDKKTVFSQVKYKIKKQKKHAPKVLLRRPFSRSICEAYFKKYPTRIGSLRVDALSLLLSMANVCAFSNVLVFDMVGGLLTGAVAERIGGTGYVCSTHFGTTRNPIDIVRMFNFSTEVNNRIVQASFTDLSLVQENDIISSHQEILKTWNDRKSASFSAESIPPKISMPVVENDAFQEVPPKISMPVVENDAFQEVNIPFNTSCVSYEILELEQSSPHTHSHPPVEDFEEGSSVLPAAEKLAIPGKQASPELMKFWREIGFSSLIFVTPELEVESLVLKLVPLLSYSAPFAIYNHCLQSLAMCMHKLQASKMAISLQISEPWLREYQVLPSRTHPHMQMSAFGGYILSGIRIGSDACHVSNGN